MNKSLWMVTKFEFIRQLKKPSFWATILLIPLMIVGIMMISILSSGSANSTPALDENTKIAITDDAGILPKESPFVVSYNAEEGKQKVINKEIDLYF